MATKARGSKADGLDSAEVKIDNSIRYKIKDPYRSLDIGSTEQVEKTIVSYSTALTRAIASRVKMDALIAQKMEIGKKIHEAFRKNGTGGQMKQVKATIQPWMSYFLFIFYFGIFVYFVPLVFFNLPAFPTIALACIFLFAGLCGWHHIETGHLGVLTMFGGRAKPLKLFGRKIGNLAKEGYHWLPWPIFSYISVDVREKTVPNRDIKVIAGNSADAGDTIPPGIADMIDETYGPDSGVDVLDVITEEVMPTNQEIIKAREAKKIEEGKSAAQDLDMRRQANRAKNLRKLLPELSDTEAMRAVQAQEKQMTREETIVTVSGTGEVDKLVGAAIAVAQRWVKGKEKNGKKKDKQGGGT